MEDFHKIASICDPDFLCFSHHRIGRLCGVVVLLFELWVRVGGRQLARQEFSIRRWSGESADSYFFANPSVQVNTWSAGQLGSNNMRSKSRSDEYDMLPIVRVMCFERVLNSLCYCFDTRQTTSAERLQPSRTRTKLYDPHNQELDRERAHFKLRKDRNM